MQQLDFDLTKAQAEQERGLEQVESHSKQWMEEARRIASRIANSKGTVTTDDLRQQISRPRHQNAWGAIFRGDDWIAVGMCRSKLTSNHARMIRIWAPRK